MRLPQWTGFFRHLRGGASKSEFIRVTKRYTRLTSWISRLRKCYGVSHCKEWSRYIVLTRRSAIFWIFALPGILISCSCHESGNCVTIFLLTMLLTLCLPKNSEPHWSHGMVDSLPLQAMRQPSSSSDPTNRITHPQIVDTDIGGIRALLTAVISEQAPLSEVFRPWREGLTLWPVGLTAVSHSDPAPRLHQPATP